MSGPKVDVAELRRQEMEKLERARHRRLALSDAILCKMRQIEGCLDDYVRGNKDLEGPCKELEGLQSTYLEQLRELLETVKKGNELLDCEGIEDELTLLAQGFDREAKAPLETIQKMRAGDAKYRAMEEQRKKLGSLKRVEIRKISQAVAKKGTQIDQAQIDEQIRLFEAELTEFLGKPGIPNKKKNSILTIYQDLKALSESEVDLYKKSKRINHLFEDYEKMIELMQADIEEMKQVYARYTAECFDASSLRKLEEFGSAKEIEQAIEEAREAAKVNLSREYIKRQIDEVMAKHGYDVVRSDLLEQTEAAGQILYGVDQETAINVFVSNENQVTMRVVGIGFDDQISAEENERLYGQQCAFCSLHPQITAELAMRGVILHTKKHLAPDRKYNKKIQTKSKSGNQSVSRAKKELKRTGTKVMRKGE